MRRSETFEPDPASVRAARQFALQALRGTPAALLEQVELMVSELATNSIRHGNSAFTLTVSRSPSEVRVEVRDGSSGRPEMRSPQPDEPTGRGLQIIDLLADAWGVDKESGAGKTVWLTLSTGSAPLKPA